MDNGAKVLLYCVLPVPPSTSSGNISARKATQTPIRAPLESPHSQLSNGARMSIWVVLHAELCPFEIEGGTGRTQYTSTFAILFRTKCTQKFKKRFCFCINGAKVLVYCVLPVPLSISNGHNSACKATQTFIGAPLES